MEYNYAFLILLLPFLSFLVLGLVGMKMKRPVAALIGTVLMGCVFAICRLIQHTSTSLQWVVMPLQVCTQLLPYLISHG